MATKKKNHQGNRYVRILTVANLAFVIHTASKISALITSAFLYSMVTLLTELALHFWAGAHSGAFLKELANLIPKFSFTLALYKLEENIK